MKALVTGGTGFLGSHIVRLLCEEGHGVRVLHRASSKSDTIALLYPHIFLEDFSAYVTIKFYNAIITSLITLLYFNTLG